MVKLIRMMMAVIGAALLNKILKESLTPSTNLMNSRNKLQILQNVINTILLLRSKDGWLMQPAAISTFSAFMSSLMKSLEGSEHKDRIIEIDDYKVVDEKEDRIS